MATDKKRSRCIGCLFPQHQTQLITDAFLALLCRRIAMPTDVSEPPSNLALHRVHTSNHLTPVSHVLGGASLPSEIKCKALLWPTMFRGPFRPSAWSRGYAIRRPGPVPSSETPRCAIFHQDRGYQGLRRLEQRPDGEKVLGSVPKITIETFKRVRKRNAKASPDWHGRKILVSP